MHELTFDQLKFWQLWVISDIKVYVQQKLIEILRVSMYIECKWSRHYPPKFKVSWLFKLSANHVHLIIVCPYLMGRRMVRWCPCIQYGFLSFGLWLLSKEKWGELLNARFCRFIHDIIINMFLQCYKIWHMATVALVVKYVTNVSHHNCCLSLGLWKKA